MKTRLRSLYIFYLLLLTAISVSAQTVVEIPTGNPNFGSSRKPLGAYFAYERSVMVYDKTEINGGSGIPANSSISEVAFYLESVNCPPGLDYSCRIYIKEVAPASLTSSTYDNAIAGAQLVFDGLLPASNWTTVPHWVPVALQNCFIFQNNNNSIEVLVETNFGDPPTSDLNGWFGNGCSNNNSWLFRYSNTVNANYASWASDNTPPAGSATPSTTDRPNIRLTYSPATPCSTLSTVGTQSSVSSVCAGTSFILSMPALPCLSGLTFQWQAATVASGIYNNINSATASKYTATQWEATNYRCVITCAASSSSINSTPVLVNQNSTTSCYCTASPSGALDTDIGNVTLTRLSTSTTVINNPAGGCSPIQNNANAVGTYSNYKVLGPFSVIQGENYSINLCQITSSTTFHTANFNVFIDWNADGVFDVVNERVFSSAATSLGAPTAQTTFTIPFASDTGQTVMRIVLKESGGANDPACGSFSFGEVEDYLLNIVAGAACNLTSAGTTVSNFASVCVNQPLTLSISGNATVGSYQTWQWQLSTDGTNYSNILGATFSSYQTTQTVNTWYRCVLRCSGGAAQITTPVSVPMSSPVLCYCIPPYSNSCTSSTISNVVFNTISNVTTCSNGAATSYTQFPTTGSTTTSVTQGTTYNLSVRSGGSGNGIISAWFDWNRNGIFESNEWYQPANNNPSGTTATISVLVPSGAQTGITGMRIRSRSTGSQNGAGDACTQFLSGEAEDYFITVNAGASSPCNTVAVPGIDISTTDATPCSGNTFTLTLSSLPINNNGYTYQWQSSATNSAFSNVSGEINYNLITGQTQTTYYRAVYGCSNAPYTGNAISDTIVITTSPNYWKGVNNNWSDPVNWCSRVPKITDDVLISRTQPGVANPYYAPLVSVADTLLAKNLTVGDNDTITIYNDTLNSVNIAQTVTVNGKVIVRTSISDTCCTGTSNGTATNAVFQPFITNVAENRLQIIYIANDFASFGNLTNYDEVTYLLLQLSQAPDALPASGTFQNVTVSYGWLPLTTTEFTSATPYATPYTASLIPSLNLITKITGDTIMIPLSNFKWRTDSNLVLQICYNTPTGNVAAGGVPSYGVKVQDNVGRKSTLSLRATSSSLGIDGCSMLTSSHASVTSDFNDVRPNIRFIFGRKPKKLSIPIGGDLTIAATGLFTANLSNITVAGNVTNDGTINIDTCSITVTSSFTNAGTCNMGYIYAGTNETSSITVGTALNNSGTFSMGKSSASVGGTGFNNTGIYNAATANTFTLTGTNFNNNGTFNPGTTTLIMNSAAAQSIGGANPLTLYRIRLTKTANTNLLTLNNNAITVTDSINIILGSIDLNSKTLTFTNPAVQSIRSNSGSSGYIITPAGTNYNGRFKWTIGTNSLLHTWPFCKTPVATTTYLPFEFTNVAGAADNVGDISVGTYSTATNNTPLPSDVLHINNAAGANNSANMADRFWNISRSTPATGSGNTTLGFHILNSERASGPPAANTLRAQPYYTYYISGPPVQLVAGWLAAPGTQAGSTSVGVSLQRINVTSYNWPTNAGAASPWAIATVTSSLANDTTCATPVLNMPDSTYICGNAVTLNAGAGYSAYLWSTTATTPSINVTQNGWYSCKVNNDTCSTKDSSYVSLLVANIINNDTAICAGTSISLTATASGGGSPLYMWSNGATTAGITVSPSQTTTYYCTVTKNNQQCTDSVKITVNALPVALITAGGPTNFCNGDSVTLSAAAASAYLWNTGATSQSIKVYSTGNYIVTVTNAAGCTAVSSSAGVTVDSCQVTLTLKLYIEGFYNNGGTMNPSIDPINYPSLSDILVAELHYSTPPYALFKTKQSTISTNGWATFIFPVSVMNESYYIVVKHRNSLETWSKNPVLFNASSIIYDFTQ